MEKKVRKGRNEPRKFDIVYEFEVNGSKTNTLCKLMNVKSLAQVEMISLIYGIFQWRNSD